MLQPILRTASKQPYRLVRFKIPSTRALSSTRRLQLKEDKAQSASDIEQAKQEQLKSGTKKEELESQSESVVGADREKVKDHDAHIEELQKDAAKEKQREHPEGKS